MLDSGTDLTVAAQSGAGASNYAVRAVNASALVLDPSTSVLHYGQSIFDKKLRSLASSLTGQRPSAKP